MKKIASLTIVGITLAMMACGDESTTAPVVQDPVDTADTTTVDTTIIVEDSVVAEVPGATVDDMSSQDGKTSDGRGLWFGDDDHINNGTSTVLDKNGNSLAQALDTQACAAATSGSGDEDGDGNSDCYVGWNLDNGDAYSADGALQVDLEMSEYVNPEGWGWAAAGLVLQFEGSTSDTIPQGFAADDTLEIRLTYPAGKELTVKALETQYVDVNTNSVAKTTLTGSGSPYVYKIAMSDFLVPDWAENTFNPADVWRLSIGKQAAASAEGQAFPASAAGVDQLSIYCIGFSGACSQ